MRPTPQRPQATCLSGISAVALLEPTVLPPRVLGPPRQNLKLATVCYLLSFPLPTDEVTASSMVERNDIPPLSIFPPPPHEYCPVGWICFQSTPPSYVIVLGEDSSCFLPPFYSENAIKLIDLDPCF